MAKTLPALSVWTFLAASFGQIACTPPPRPVDVSLIPVRPCNTGPAPQVTATVIGVYVHLVWDPVPGARAYSIERLYEIDTLNGPSWIGSVITPPLFGGYPDTAASPSLGFWDAVPDVGRAYQYKVLATQRLGCVGTTMFATNGPIWTPNAPGIAGLRSAPTIGTLSWAEDFGVLAYRVSGSGIPTPWMELKAGTFTEGSKPALAVDSNLAYQNNRFTYTLSNMPITTADYALVAVYPNGIVSNAVHASVPQGTCSIDSFSPASGSAGTVLSIKGKHFEKASRVLFNSAQSTAAPLAVSPTSVTVVVPDLSYWFLPQDMSIQLDTEWGRCEALSKFHATDPPKVTVPPLINKSLQSAMQLLHDNQLVFGSVTAGSNAATALVQTENPQAGAKVSPGTVVNVSTTTGSAASGFKELQLLNNLPSGAAVYVWLVDYSMGDYVEQNGGNLLASQGTATVTIPSGHWIAIYDVDPQNPQCGGRNDPADTGACVVWQSNMVFLGDASGSSLPITMQ
jgi:hypothetical protein